MRAYTSRAGSLVSMANSSKYTRVAATAWGSHDRPINRLVCEKASRSEVDRMVHDLLGTPGVTHVTVERVNGTVYVPGR